MLSSLLSSRDPEELREIHNYLGIAAFVIDVEADQSFRLMAINGTHEENTGRKHNDVSGRLIDEVGPRG